MTDIGIDRCRQRLTKSRFTPLQDQSFPAF